MENIDNKIELDYSSLVKIFPIALGLSVFANLFASIEVKDLCVVVAFIIIFILFSIDSIIEFGRYNYSNMPFSIKALSFLYGFVLLCLVASFSFYKNDKLHNYSIDLLFYSLAAASFIEFLFSMNLNFLIRKGKIKVGSIDYDEKDTWSYCIWEILFILLYLFFSVKYFANYFGIQESRPWIALSLLVIEISAFNYYKRK